MRIKEIMTPTVISIRSDQSLLEVRELMLSNNLRRIPVTDKEGLLMGIVTDGVCFPGYAERCKCAGPL